MVYYIANSLRKQLKKEDFLRAFDTENPSIEKYLNWVLKNNPFASPFQSWDPPLNSQEKLFISDVEFVEECEWKYKFSESWEEPIIGSAWVIIELRRAKKTDLSDVDLVDLLFELKEIRDEHLWSGKKKKDIEIKLILEKHGIFIDVIIADLENKFQQRKNKIFGNLSEWIIDRTSGVMKADYSFHRIGNLLTDEEYKGIWRNIIQVKLEDIKKNPQNWVIYESGGINLFPFQGSVEDHVENKNNKCYLCKNDFSQQEWKELKKALGGNKFFFSIVAIILVILFFLVFLVFWYRKKRRIFLPRNTARHPTRKN